MCPGTTGVTKEKFQSRSVAGGSLGLREEVREGKKKLSFSINFLTPASSHQSSKMLSSMIITVFRLRLQARNIIKSQ